MTEILGMVGKKIGSLKWKIRKTEVQEGEEKTREDRDTRFRRQNLSLVSRQKKTNLGENWKYGRVLKIEWKESYWTQTYKIDVQKFR